MFVCSLQGMLATRLYTMCHVHCTCWPTFCSMNSALTIGAGGLQVEEEAVQHEGPEPRGHNEAAGADKDRAAARGFEQPPQAHALLHEVLCVVATWVHCVVSILE